MSPALKLMLKPLKNNLINLFDGKKNGAVHFLGGSLVPGFDLEAGCLVHDFLLQFILLLFVHIVIFT